MHECFGLPRGMEDVCPLCVLSGMLPRNKFGIKKVLETLCLALIVVEILKAYKAVLTAFLLLLGLAEIWACGGIWFHFTVDLGCYTVVKGNG